METEIGITSAFTWLRVTQIAIWDERKTEEEGMAGLIFGPSGS